jgi:hypothetical protein
MISEGRLLTSSYTNTRIYTDSKLLSGFPLTGHGNPDSNLESLCITIVTILPFVCYTTLHVSTPKSVLTQWRRYTESEADRSWPTDIHATCKLSAVRCYGNPKSCNMYNEPHAYKTLFICIRRSKYIISVVNLTFLPGFKHFQDMWFQFNTIQNPVVETRVKCVHSRLTTLDLG